LEGKEGRDYSGDEVGKPNPDESRDKTILNEGETHRKQTVVEDKHGYTNADR
jgi:hypothetical protein